MAKDLKSQDTKKKIEVEIKGMLIEKQYNLLMDRLKKESESYEPDKKISYFFVIKNRILKVTDEISKNRAKITIKIGDETINILEEIEIPIPQEQVENAVKMFKHLGFTRVNRVEQKRINFQYKDTSVSLKYSDDWGYHFEIETIIDNKKSAGAEKLKLESVCKDLGIVPMTPNEIRKKIEEINTRHELI